MKTKSLVLSAILLAMGTLLHYITPPLLFGMKPDFLLVMMFLCIIITKDFKSALIVSSGAGLIAAMTTGFPGGQIPSIIDKVATGLFIYFLYAKVFKFELTNIRVGIINVLGTIISGLIFLAIGLTMVGMLDKFLIMAATIVLPTSLINTALGFVLYKSISTAGVKKLIKN